MHWEFDQKIDTTLTCVWSLWTASLALSKGYKMCLSAPEARQFTCYILFVLIYKKKCKNEKLWFYEGLCTGLSLGQEQWPPLLTVKLILLFLKSTFCQIPITSNQESYVQILVNNCNTCKYTNYCRNSIICLKVRNSKEKWARAGKSYKERWYNPVRSRESHSLPRLAPLCLAWGPLLLHFPSLLPWLLPSIPPFLHSFTHLPSIIHPAIHQSIMSTTLQPSQPKLPSRTTQPEKKHWHQHHQSNPPDLPSLKSLSCYIKRHSQCCNAA